MLLSKAESGQVQELVSGRLWCYPDAALQPVPEDSVPLELRHPPSPGEGSYVTLVPGFRPCSDAARGPLRLLRNEEAYGIMLMESGQRYKVRACHSRKDWWFDYGALRPVHLKYVPEALRAAVRPAWGDYGPLERGNLGVVVAVADAADSEGGLGRARYLEGAVHLVVQQLMHAPKIPPSTGKGRRRRLQFTLVVTEAGSGSDVPVGAVLRRGQQRVHQVAVVTPGRKYWLAARLSCNDDHLMLANLKPCALNLYAPSGRPGSFLQLKPVRCTQQILSLAACNGSAAAGVAAAAGSDTWYDPFEDDAVCVFEWDSAETPLALKQNRVTQVDFVWGVCFDDLEGIFTKRHTVCMQAAAPPSCAAAEPAAAAAAMQHSGRAAGGAAQQLRADALSDSSTDAVVLDCWWLARSARSRHPAHRHGNGGSSSSSDSSSNDEEDEDAGAEQADDSCSNSDEEDANDDAGGAEEEGSSDADDDAGGATAATHAAGAAAAGQAAANEGHSTSKAVVVLAAAAAAALISGSAMHQLLHQLLQRLALHGLRRMSVPLLHGKERHLHAAAAAVEALAGISRVQAEQASLLQRSRVRWSEVALAAAVQQQAAAGVLHTAAQAHPGHPACATAALAQAAAAAEAVTAAAVTVVAAVVAISTWTLQVQRAAAEAEGNELAQALAAKAMAAAEQFLPDNWRHPCLGSAQQQQEGQR
ncbi:hypothetical protein COO60DRAFT_1638797 [Scenedesmus sp. NREL 46B-D3]|nr:hypothetical protein COO60DRAFT_1638797 [Scenedesmus sp. NREL 46B-D3]